MATAPLSLGQRIKDRRRLLGLTLAQVGERLGLANGNFVGMVERGERTPSDERMLALAEVLTLPGKELLTLKYAASPRSEVGRLLAPDEPTYPRLRRFMLGICRSPDAAEREFRRGAHALLERLVWQVLLEHVVVPGVDSDRFAPRRIREHLRAHQRRRRRDSSLLLSPAWFEEEADLLGPWARTRLLGWDFDLDRLTISVEHSRSTDDATVVFLAAPPLPLQASPQAPHDDVPELLLAAGLGDDDVDEILTLIELKRRRRARESQAD